MSLQGADTDQPHTEAPTALWARWALHGLSWAIASAHDVPRWALAEPNDSPKTGIRFPAPPLSNP